MSNITSNFISHEDEWPANGRNDRDGRVIMDALIFFWPQQFCPVILLDRS